MAKNNVAEIPPGYYLDGDRLKRISVNGVNSVSGAAARATEAATVFAPEAKPRANKYGNRKTVVDGITFDSAKEAKRYGELKLLEKAGVISDLRLQVRFPLAINGVYVCAYVADFTYSEGDRRTTEDCKGFLTPIYRLKKKLMLAIYGIVILET